MAGMPSPQMITPVARDYLEVMTLGGCDFLCVPSGDCVPH